MTKEFGIVGVDVAYVLPGIFTVFFVTEQPYDVFVIARWWLAAGVPRRQSHRRSGLATL